MNRLFHAREQYYRLVAMLNAGHGVLPDRAAEILDAAEMTPEDLAFDTREARSRQAGMIAAMERAEAEQESILSDSRAA